MYEELKPATFTSNRVNHDAFSKICSARTDNYSRTHEADIANHARRTVRLRETNRKRRRRVSDGIRTCRWKIPTSSAVTNKRLLYELSEAEIAVRMRSNKKLAQPSPRRRRHRDCCRTLIEPLSEESSWIRQNIALSADDGALLSQWPWKLWRIGGITATVQDQNHDPSRITASSLRRRDSNLVIAVPHFKSAAQRKNGQVEVSNVLIRGPSRIPHYFDFRV